MKVLIVGGCSSLAQELKSRLSDFCHILTSGRKSCDIYMDLSDSIDKITIPSGIDTIIHTAAHFGGKSDIEIIEAENVNALGTLKLCQAAANANVKHFVLISTIFSTITENSNHYNIYSISKKHAEDLADYYCKLNNLSLCILRPSQIYGEGETFRKHQPFFYSILDNAMQHNDINLYGKHDPLRNYIHIKDLAEIIALIIQQKTEGTFSCTSMNNISYSQIANTAFKAFNTNGMINFIKDKPDIPDNINEIDDTLYKKIGFYPQITLEEGIKRIVLKRIRKQ